MVPHTRRSVPVTLAVTGLSHARDEQNPLFCTYCGSPLEVHQPDADLPYKMLATCDDCHVWFLVSSEPDSDEALMIELPEVSHVLPGEMALTSRRNGTQG